MRASGPACGAGRSPRPSGRAARSPGVSAAEPGSNQPTARSPPVRVTLPPGLRNPAGEAGLYLNGEPHGGYQIIVATDLEVTVALVGFLIDSNLLEPSGLQPQTSARLNAFERTARRRFAW